MSSASKRKREVPLSPLIEKAVKQARAAQPAKEASRRVVAPGTMVEAPSYIRLAPTPSKSASPVKNAEGDESEDELLIEQASRRKVTRPSPCRPSIARSQPVASTSKVPYTPPQTKRKLESEEHQLPVSPDRHPPAPNGDTSSKGKGRAPVRVKEEIDNDVEVVNKKDGIHKLAAHGRPAVPTPTQSRTNAVVEIPYKRQPQSTDRPMPKSRKKSIQVQAAPTPTSMKRPKIEEPDEDVIFVPRMDAAPPEAAVVREGVGEPPLAPDPPEGAVAYFLTHQCDPPIPQDRVQNLVDLFRKLGISTEDELKVIAKPGNVQDFWMGVARKEGLNTLWEAVIRDGLGKLVQ